MSKKVLKLNKGFTIVELLIASGVFAVVLLLCATAIVQVGRQYYKGAIINRTQVTARSIVDDIAQAIQFGAKTYNAGGFLRTAVSGSTQAVCVGDIRYSFNTLNSVGSAAGQQVHVLWKDRVGAANACVPLNITTTNPAGSSPDGQELLGSDMRVPKLAVAASGDNFNISVIIAYGKDSSLFLSGSNFTACQNLSLGGQFCAVSSINTTVAQRL